MDTNLFNVSGSELIKGTVKVPPSKSILHRALFLAALSVENCELVGINLCSDIIATINVLNALGIGVKVGANSIFISSSINCEFLNADCANSGSTLRFLICILAALKIKAKLLCGEQLLKRLSKNELERLKDFGINCCMEKNTVYVSEELKSGEYCVAEQTTSQFISGLMMASPLLEQSSKLKISVNQGSLSYVLLTSEIMKSFGVDVQIKECEIYIPNAKYHAPAKFQVECDYSAASFWFVAAALGFEITVQIKTPSVQGDFSILRLLEKFGAIPIVCESGISFSVAVLSGCSIDARHIPDLVPILMVLGALVPGQTKIMNVERLRFKESDRVVSMVMNLLAIGGDARYENGEILINGKEGFVGGEVKSFGDHRIAMAMCIAALKAKSGIEIDDISCIKKSYPTFIADFLSLGGVIHGV